MLEGNSTMQIAVGSDHRGCDMRGKVIELLKQLGHDVVDEGTNETCSVDYPDIAAVVAGKVSNGKVDRGILICGTGLGMCIAANKFSGVRAAPCYDDLTAEISRRHNNLNVLCLSSDMLGERAMNSVVSTWLKTEFDHGRHERRIHKIAELEQSDNRD